MANDASFPFFNLEDWLDYRYTGTLHLACRYFLGFNTLL